MNSVKDPKSVNASTGIPSPFISMLSGLGSTWNSSPSLSASSRILILLLKSGTTALVNLKLMSILRILRSSSFRSHCNCFVVSVFSPKLLKSNVFPIWDGALVTLLSFLSWCCTTKPPSVFTRTGSGRIPILLALTTSIANSNFP